MKLLYYTYRKLAVWLLLLLVGWGTLFYYTMMDEIMDETDDTLANNAARIVERALADPSILHTYSDELTTYYFHPLSMEQGLTHRDLYYDSFVYVELEDEDEPVRVLRTAFRMPNGQYYELELMTSTLERNDLIEAMMIYLACLFVLLMTCSLTVTRYILRRAFRPLGRLINWLHTLRPDAEPTILNNPTRISEFQQLNNAAQDMANRNRKVYMQQKQFIENASHELQTPLAIARGKIELLAEAENLNEIQMQELDAIYNTLGRAIRLNKSLLLLSRIENGQYAEAEAVSIDRLTDELLPDLADVYEHKKLTIERNHGIQPFITECNQALAHILVSNLLKNALLHSPNGGRIVVETTSHSLQISNTGQQPLDKGKLFTRFAHSATRKAESTGLGLAIAHSIATHSRLKLSYLWKNNMHIFTLSSQTHM